MRDTSSLNEYLEEQNKPITCWFCGQSMRPNGWGEPDKPICADCLNHIHHRRFDRRCARCLLDRDDAIREAKTIKSYRERRDSETLNES